MNFIVPAQHPVCRVLKANRGAAFTSKEIAKRTRLHISTVTEMLRKLKKKGLVIHKSPYYAINTKKVK
jgi:Mn-dependent DtxR family transcriptional regulator